MNATISKRFRAVRIETTDGQPLLRLTREWEGLAVGTEVQAMWNGKPNLAGPGRREVFVATGPRAGQIVRGLA
jgi:hypothetical protein